MANDNDLMTLASLIKKLLPHCKVIALSGSRNLGFSNPHDIDFAVFFQNDQELESDFNIWFEQRTNFYQNHPNCPGLDVFFKHYQDNKPYYWLHFRLKFLLGDAKYIRMPDILHDDEWRQKYYKYMYDTFQHGLSHNWSTNFKRLYHYYVAACYWLHNDYILTPEEHALAEKFHDRQATQEDLELLVSMWENIKKDLKEN